MRKLTIALLVAALALAAGCGGSDKKSDSDNNSNSNSDSNSNSNSNSSGDDEFTKLIEKENKAKLRVTYKTGDSETTISRDGTGEVAYITDDTQLIQDGDTVTQCSGLPDNPECQEVSGQMSTGLISAMTGFLTLPNLIVEQWRKAGKDWGDTSTETIAGREAECVTITIGDLAGGIGSAIGAAAGADLSAGYKSCRDKETGVGLLWASTGDKAETVFEATEVGDPKDSDFTPPATPEQVTVPTLPGGVTIPGLTPNS